MEITRDKRPQCATKLRLKKLIRVQYMRQNIHCMGRYDIFLFNLFEKFSEQHEWVVERLIILLKCCENISYRYVYCTPNQSGWYKLCYDGEKQVICLAIKVKILQVLTLRNLKFSMRECLSMIKELQQSIVQSLAFQSLVWMTHCSKLEHIFKSRLGHLFLIFKRVVDVW